MDGGGRAIKGVVVDNLNGNDTTQPDNQGEGSGDLPLDLTISLNKIPVRNW